MSKCPLVSHVEWCCSDVQTSAQFLNALFGWQFSAFGNNYLLFTPESGPAIGLIHRDPVPRGENCLVFIEVSSIDSYQAQAQALGGTVAVARTAIKNYGWYAQFNDPDANRIGLFEPLTK